MQCLSPLYWGAVSRESGQIVWESLHTAIDQQFISDRSAGCWVCLTAASRELLRSEFVQNPPYPQDSAALLVFGGSLYKQFLRELVVACGAGAAKCSINLKTITDVWENSESWLHWILREFLTFNTVYDAFENTAQSKLWVNCSVCFPNKFTEKNWTVHESHVTIYVFVHKHQRMKCFIEIEKRSPVKISSESLSPFSDQFIEKNQMIHESHVTIFRVIKMFYENIWVSTIYLVYTCDAFEKHSPVQIANESFSPFSEPARWKELDNSQIARHYFCVYENILWKIYGFPQSTYSKFVMIWKHSPVQIVRELFSPFSKQVHWKELVNSQIAHHYFYVFIQKHHRTKCFIAI